MVDRVIESSAAVSEQGILSKIASRIRSLITAVPELTLLVLLLGAIYVGMGMFSQVEGTEVLSASSIWLVLFGSFIASVAIAIFAVLAGIGGGVIYTPLMLGFTSIDTLVIRATGLVVAMFSGLISTGPFMRKGLANIRLVVYAAVPITLGAVSGAVLAIYLQEVMGATGDALVRLLLGLVVLFCFYLFIKGGSKYEYPEATHEDRIGKKLGFNFSYWEESLGKEISWRNQRVLMGGLILLLVGLLGGFFGLGGGWAAVPVLNILMATPLKVAAASSGVLLAIGNGAGIWPYVSCGALIAVFVAPWMLGQVVGGILGAHILVRIKVGVIRYMLIVILGFTALKLVARGIEGLAGIDIPVL